MTDWTAPRMAHLTRRWRDGATASTIARELGVTRNAIMGKAHRLDLGGRPSPIRTNNPAATNRKRQASLKATLAQGGRPRDSKAGANDMQDAKQRTAQATARPAAPVNVKGDDRGDRWSWKPRLGLSRMDDGARHSSRDACAWPIGDPKHPDFKFCAAKPVVPGKPYCAACCAKAYRSPDEKPESEAA